MRVRQATTRDLSRLTEITLAGLPDDPTFDYAWPNRHQYPDDNAFFWHVHLKEMLYDPAMSFLVVELDPDDHGPSLEDKTALSAPSTVISYGIWERIGKSSGARKIAREKNTLSNRFDRFSAWLERKSLYQKYARRDGSPARQAALDFSSAEVRQKYFKQAGIVDWWSMELLVTDRPYRGHGAAGQLVAWGCKQADREGLWAGVEASPLGHPVYAAAGFEVKGTETAKADGEEEKLDFLVMMRKPRLI